MHGFDVVDCLRDCGCEGLGGGSWGGRRVGTWRDRGGAVIVGPAAQGFELAEARPGELHAAAGDVGPVRVAVDGAVDAGYDGGVGGAGDAVRGGHLSEVPVRVAVVHDGALLACWRDSAGFRHPC